MKSKVFCDLKKEGEGSAFPQNEKHHPCGWRQKVLVHFAYGEINGDLWSPPFGFSPTPSREIKKTPATRAGVFFMARLGGLEPSTYWFVARHSIQLS